MPDVPITLVPWFDAKDNPPEEKARVYSTNLGLLYLRAFASKVEWVELDDEGHAHVQHPRVYCEDPSPPGDDALTLDDLRVLCTDMPLTHGNEDHAHRHNQAVARLRRALAALPKEDDRG